MSKFWPMRFRTYKNTDLTVSEVGFGPWTISTGWWGNFTEGEAIDLMPLLRIATSVRLVAMRWVEETALFPESGVTHLEGRALSRPNNSHGTSPLVCSEENASRFVCASEFPA